jgi:hypothetical protein
MPSFCAAGSKAKVQLFPRSRSVMSLPHQIPFRTHERYDEIQHLNAMVNCAFVQRRPALRYGCEKPIVTELEKPGDPVQSPET